MKPIFFVVAGPNGVGKSSASFQYLPIGVELINSDDIARQIRLEQPHQEVVQRLTNEAAQQRIRQHIRNWETFAVETNLHEIETWQYFLAIQQSGYEFRLLFLCVDDLLLLNQRVLSRHLQGGHFVREDVVRGRYVAGLSLLNHFFNAPDTVTLFDASDQLEIVYQQMDGEISYQKDFLPAWVTANLPTHFGAVPFGEASIRTPTSVADARTQYQQRTQSSQHPSKQ